MSATFMSHVRPPPPVLVAPTAMEAAHLCLLPGAVGTEGLAGVWWPRTRDLARELPALLLALAGRLGTVERLTVRSATWPEPPRRITVGGHTYGVGRYPGGAHEVEVCVLSGTAGRWDLLVVPPDCVFAGEEMAHAAGLLSLDRPAARLWETLARARQEVERWESEGGAAAAPAPPVP